MIDPLLKLIYWIDFSGLKQLKIDFYDREEDLRRDETVLNLKYDKGAIAYFYDKIMPNNNVEEIQETFQGFVEKKIRKELQQAYQIIREAMLTLNSVERDNYLKNITHDIEHLKNVAINESGLNDNFILHQLCKFQEYLDKASGARQDIKNASNVTMKLNWIGELNVLTTFFLQATSKANVKQKIFLNATQKQIINLIINNFVANGDSISEGTLRKYLNPNEKFKRTRRNMELVDSAFNEGIVENNAVVDQADKQRVSGKPKPRSYTSLPQNANKGFRNQTGKKL
ncbi:MAG TPA: hypothetical protein VGE24_15005 [Emticicia sp.]